MQAAQSSASNTDPIPIYLGSSNGVVCAADIVLPNTATQHQYMHHYTAHDIHKCQSPCNLPKIIHNGPHLQHSPACLHATAISIGKEGPRQWIVRACWQHVLPRPPSSWLCFTQMPSHTCTFSLSSNVLSQAHAVQQVTKGETPELIPDPPHVNTQIVLTELAFQIHTDLHHAQKSFPAAVPAASTWPGTTWPSPLETSNAAAE